MATTKKPISDMTTGAIAANDLIPFVYVPGSGIKSNKKTTFADLKTAILTNNFGGVVSFARVAHLDSGGADMGSFGGYVETKIDNTPSFPAQYLTSQYTATLTNSGATTIGVDYRQNLYIIVALSDLALPANDLYDCDYEVETYLNGALVHKHKMSSKFFTTPDFKCIDEEYKTFNSEARFTLAPAGVATITHKIKVTRFERQNGTIPVASNLLNLRVVNNMADNINNISIFKA